MATHDRLLVSVWQNDPWSKRNFYYRSKERRPLPIVQQVDDGQEEDGDDGTAVDSGDATEVLGDREMEDYVRHETAVSAVLGVVLRWWRSAK
jgi:hypothetical protein